jgi:hypothetical protein
MRDQAIKDAKALQKKNEELVFENNYLKGQLLSLKFACLYNRVDVPKFWDTGLRDRIGSEKMTFSRGKEIPQPLEFFLDKERLIFSISPEELKQNMTEKTPSQPHHTTSPSTQHTSSPPNSTSYNMHEPALSPTSTMSSIQPEHPSPFSVQDLNPDMMQFLLQPDLLEGIINTVKDLPPDLWMQFIPPELSAMVPPEMFTHIIQSAEAQKNKMDYDVPSMNQTSPLPQQQSVAPQKGPQADPDFWLDTNNPLTNDSKVFVPGPMSPYDAVNHLRSLRNENDNFLFTPSKFYCCHVYKLMIKLNTPPLSGITTENTSRPPH